MSMEKIFYLMSRGLDEQLAKKIIIFGFFDPLISSSSDPKARAEIMQLLEQKWSGQKILDYTDSKSGAKFTDMFEGHYKYR